MHEITLLSGKGGTGKTTVTAALTALAAPAVICDNDVDAADLFLVLNPTVKQEAPFVSGWTAQINTEQCTQCGICVTNCRFDAIENKHNEQYTINPYACEGCRLCERTCPQGAITSHQNSGNIWFESTTRFGSFIHAQMGAGEENSGKLVTFIRKKAKEKAIAENAQYIINDGPPGIGCPVIAALTGTKQVLLVIEPSQTGWHDALRLIELINNFTIPISAIINKTGINPKMETLIEHALTKHHIPLLGKIPYSKLFREAMIHQQTIIEYAPKSGEADILRDIWNSLLEQKRKVFTDVKLLTT